MIKNTTPSSKEKGNMAPEFPMPRETWEVFNLCFQALPKGSLEKIFGVEYGQIRRYCRNPDFTSDSQCNPLDRLSKLFSKISDQYGKDGQTLVMGALLMLAKAAGLDISVSPDDIHPDQDDMSKECLDDYPTLVLMHQLIQSGEHISVVRQQAEKHIIEVKETLALYEEKSK